MLSAQEQRFVDEQRVGHLASADSAAVPHVIPVCFVVSGGNGYISIDQKPKTARSLKRIRNLTENPRFALVVDRYDEDWNRLAWVLLRGAAEILREGSEHDRAQVLLRKRYAQYEAMQLQPLPVIALRIESVTSWGNLNDVKHDQ